MYSLVRVPHPPTGVEHSVYARFFGPDEENLVVAGSNVLRVFRLVPDDADAAALAFDKNGSRPPKMRLECMASFSLNGVVMGLEKITLSGSVRDTLVMSFLEAKLSVVEYDPECHDLKTVSLHIFEDDAMKQGYVNNHFSPSLRADPKSRCVAMLAFGRRIIILPFKGEAKATIGHLSTGDGSNYVAGSGTEKSPVMASYVLDLNSVIQTHKVDNIIDFQFLHGYNQPTLLLLYEPLKTYAGRIAVRKDTCRLDVITLDVKEKISAFIWSKEMLPFDCVKALPVPKPIGGTLVLAVNSLFYLNQGIPSYGVSLNSLGDRTTDNAIKKMDGVCVTLDCAQAAFLTPEKAVLSLKGGEFYVLSLLVDGLRTVRGFHLDRIAASVLTTCLTVCHDDYIFFGSRLGNSLLLQFTEKDMGNVLKMDSRKQSQEPPGKKRRIDSFGQWMASDMNQDIDLEVYGQDEAPSSHKITSYTFEVCDSLLNIGPCGQIAMGEPAFLSEEFSSTVKADPDVELVATSGHGKSGALCVLQQTIRPQVVTTFELPGCLDMWTVLGQPDIVDGHEFLILSRQDSTIILQTGREINELDTSGFSTQGPTVFTGNIGGNKYIIQVLQQAVRLLSGSELIQELPLDMTSPISQASSADPYIAALSQDGQFILMRLDTFPSGGGHLSVLHHDSDPWIGGRSSHPLVAVCTYKDTSSLFTFSKEHGSQDHSAMTTQASASSSSFTSSSVPAANAFEDEDELLYGESAPNLFEANSSSKNDSKTEQPIDSPLEENTVWAKYLKRHDPTYWMIGLRDNGHLEIYSIPDLTLKFLVSNFLLAPNVLIHDAKASAALLTDQGNHTWSCFSNLPDFLPAESVPSVTELLMVGLGANRRRPLLLARTSDSELLVYEVFPYKEKLSHDDHLHIRFKKIQHGLLLRERKSKGRRSERSAQPAYRSQLRYFNDIGGYEGVFVCGHYPHWLMLTGRGELRTHPMPIDGSVPCFAAFNNVNCPQGFIYFNRKSELRICVLPSHLSYDASWPVRKVPLRCTPHFITYHLESKTYAVVTSTSEPTAKVWKFNGDDKELVTEERDERFPLPDCDTFHLQLFSPISWEPIPGTKLQLEDWERCTSMKHLFLSSEGMHSGQRGYIVLSTSFCYGEDCTPRGYIRVYDVIEVIPEPGQPLTKNKIKAVYEKEQKGPVTTVAAISGFLVAAIGQKVYVFQLKNKELYGMAFIDSQIYIHQLVTLKNFILVGDVLNSIDLMMYQKDYRTLAIISKDTNKLEVFSVEFVVDNTSLAFAVTDVDKNLILYTHQNEGREAPRLMRRADFNLGQHVNSMFRIRAKITDPSIGGRVIAGLEKRHVLWFGTLDGALGYLLPCSEKTFRRMQMLQTVLLTAIPHAAGLNPKSFRLLRQRRKELVNPCKGVIDGELITKFVDLPVLLKAEVAKKIGVAFQELLDDFAELNRMAAHF